MRRVLLGGLDVSQAGPGHEPYARRVPALTSADTTGTYSAKVDTSGRGCGTAARSAGDRPIRSSSTSAASTTAFRGGLRVHRSHDCLSSPQSGVCAPSALSTTANQ